MQGPNQIPNRCPPFGTGLLALVREIGAELIVDGRTAYTPTSRQCRIVVYTQPTGSAPGHTGLPTLVVLDPEAFGGRSTEHPTRRWTTGLHPTLRVTLQGVPDRDNPIVAATQVTLSAGPGTGLAGTGLAGCAHTIGRVHLRGGAAAAHSGRYVVARQLGHLTVLAASGCLTDELLPTADTAQLIAGLALGGGSGQACRRAAESVHRRGRTDRRAHARPLVVQTEPATVELATGPDPGGPLGGPLVRRELTRRIRALPESVYEAVSQFAEDGHPSGALLLRGLPTGPVPNTPSSADVNSARRPTKPDRMSELTLLTVARMLGHPVGYAPEHGGDLVQNLVPVAADSHRQVSTSSAVRLAFHTEAAFHPERPRYLALFCLRGDPQARTTWCSVPQVLGQLDLRTRAVLREPRFRTGVDESYLPWRNPTHRPGRGERGRGEPGRGEPGRGRPGAVLSGPFDNPWVTLDEDLMVATDPEAARALKALNQAIEESHLAVTLEAGDLLVIDNARAVHGRSPFTPRFDGTDRWIQRTFVVSQPPAGSESTHIIDTRFVA